MINVKSLFLLSLKPDFCSKVKVVETRPLIFLKINVKKILVSAYVLMSDIVSNQETGLGCLIILIIIISLFCLLEMHI